MAHVQVHRVVIKKESGQCGIRIFSFVYFYVVFQCFSAFFGWYQFLTFIYFFGPPFFWVVAFQFCGVLVFGHFVSHGDILFLDPDTTIRTTTAINLGDHIYYAHTSLVHHDWVDVMNTLIARKRTTLHIQH